MAKPSAQNLSDTDAVVSAKGASRARSGHLWIYRSDVTQRPRAESGSIVRVVDHRGRFIARAHYGKESEITLRIISRDYVEILPASSGSSRG